jgi:hypothetical protein
LVESRFLPEFKKTEFCRYEHLCPEVKKLGENYEGDIPDEDLLIKYKELCSHPLEGVRRISCENFKNFEIRALRGVISVLEEESKSIEEYYEQSITRSEKIN